jgi:hypothetical protein
LLLVLRRRVAAIQCPDGHFFDPVTQHRPGPEWLDNHSIRTISLRCGQAEPWQQVIG